MSKVVKFYPADAAKKPDNVLELAIGEFDEVFIIGYDKDGNMDVRANTQFKIRDILYCLDAFKFKLFNGDYETQEADED